MKAQPQVMSLSVAGTGRLWPEITWVNVTDQVQTVRGALGCQLLLSSSLQAQDNGVAVLESSTWNNCAFFGGDHQQEAPANLVGE